MRRIRLAGMGGLIGLAVVCTGCGRAVLTVDDAVSFTPGNVPLTAFLQKQKGLGYRSGIDRTPIEFSVNGGKVGGSSTQRKGRAEADCTLPGGACSTFEAKTRVGGKTLRAQGTVFTWDPTRTVIAVDIDDTLSHTDYGDLLLTGGRDSGSRPIAGSRETLQELAKHYHIAYVTSRPRFLMERSREWLNRHGYPPGPVVTSPSWEEWSDQTEFKTGELARLRKQWPNLLIGIGDKQVDVDAYSANRMLTLIVNESNPHEYGSKAVTFRSWHNLGKYFVENRELLANPTRLAQAIDHNGRIRRSPDGLVMRP
ncbi:MAG: hypothetical protein AMXMBFR13_16190 [Phycisphaerae bacterium]